MLSILGSTWGALARHRASLYAAGWLRRHRLDRPVISIGALSVGGAGKTPTTALVAALLTEGGVRPAILSRGYRRSGSGPLLVARGDGNGPLVDAAAAGDEPFWMASVLPRVPVAVATRRRDAAPLAASTGPVDVFLLDDGFQHLRLERDADLLVVNPEQPFWNDRPMPAGRLREAPAAAARADAFLLIGGDGAEAAGAGLAQRHPEAPQFRLNRQASRHWPLGTPAPEATSCGATADAPALAGTVFAFAGIARPQRFFDDLGAAGVDVAGNKAFPDHHEYRDSDLQAVAGAAAACGATSLVTTEKDAVRLPAGETPLPIHVWSYRLQAHEPERLTAWLKEQAGVSTLPDAA